MSNLIGIKEAKELLPFWKEKTIRNYTKMGRIPCTRVAGRVYYRKTELEQLAESLVQEEGGIHGSRNNKRAVSRES